MQNDSTIPISDKDPEMSAAIKQAQSSLSEFFDTFEHPSPSQKNFLLKFAFDGPDGLVEHIWVADLDLSVTPATGVIANEPSIPNVQYLERVSLDPSRITDWMYYDGEAVIGAFTTKVLENRLGNPQ
jgi:uncharacterized protein YegJ (DUF2314 family)